MPRLPLVVIGGSAGGLETLIEIVEGLPRDLAAPVVVVLHMAPDSPSMLPQILGRHGRLPARQAENGDVLEAGVLYTARPGFHVRVTDGHLTIDRESALRGNRPSIDVLFETAAAAVGAGVVGVVVSGNLHDGSAGLRAIVDAGGTAIVQDPADAAYPAMPRSAAAAVPLVSILPRESIAAAICVAVAAAVADGGLTPQADRA